MAVHTFEITPEEARFDVPLEVVTDRIAEFLKTTDCATVKAVALNLRFPLDHEGYRIGEDGSQAAWEWVDKVYEFPTIAEDSRENGKRLIATPVRALEKLLYERGYNMIHDRGDYHDGKIWLDIGKRFSFT
ncbi:MAG: hypothetical protein KKF56_03325 [Nanoarchaeota archaeon]|nr:hypothetical protein [Nanoarchaeota archaeon]